MDYFFLGTKSLGHENSVIRALRRLWLGRLVKIYPCIIHQNKSAAKSTCVRDSLSLFAVSVMLCFWLLSTARTRRLCVAVVIIIIIIIIIDLIRFIERQNVERLPCRCDNIDAGSYWITWILVRFYRCCYFTPRPGMSAKYCDERVCMSCISRKPHVQTSRNFLYVLIPVLWMTSCLPIIGEENTTPVGYIFKVTRQRAALRAKFECLRLRFYLWNLL